jgi:hypothetical protein
MRNRRASIAVDSSNAQPANAEDSAASVQAVVNLLTSISIISTPNACTLISCIELSLAGDTQ